MSGDKGILGLRTSDSIDVDRRQGGSNITVGLDGELAQAVRGWKDANGVDTIAEAVLELVRIGLLSEIAKVYGMVSDMRDRDDD